MDLASRYLPDEPSIDDLRRWRWLQLLVAAISAARDILKVGGLGDQVEISAGERYQQMVTPPLHRLTAAVAAVQLDEPGRWAALLRA